MRFKPIDIAQKISPLHQLLKRTARFDIEDDQKSFDEFMDQVKQNEINISYRITGKRNKSLNNHIWRSQI